MAAVAARGTVYYLATVNIGSVALFGYDKLQAVQGGWRVSERTLCQSALFGGWIGGLISMQLFRHKTSKQTFQRKYIAAVGQNVAGGGAVLALGLRNATFRGTFLSSAGGIFRMLSSVFSRDLPGGNGRNRPRGPRR